MYLEADVLKSTRPSGSGDLAQTLPGHSNLGFAPGKQAFALHGIEPKNDRAKYAACSSKK